MNSDVTYRKVLILSANPKSTSPLIKFSSP